MELHVLLSAMKSWSKASFMAFVIIGSTTFVTVTSFIPTVLLLRSLKRPWKKPTTSFAISDLLSKDFNSWISPLSNCTRSIPTPNNGHMASSGWVWCNWTVNSTLIHFSNIQILIILSTMVIDLISQVSMSRDEAGILINILYNTGLNSCNLWGESSTELMPTGHQLVITIIFIL